MVRDPDALLRHAFRAAVEAADPDRVVPPALPGVPDGRLVVVGAGKAAAAMARAVERHYGPEAAVEGCVVTRYGHALATRRIEVREAAHPVPDEAGERATREILALVRGAGADDLVLCLLSGGGSALLTAPEGLAAPAQRTLTAALLRSGADIHEINAVRKHLSAVKGGLLAAAAWPAPLRALVISDVVGDDPSVIASGPTVADASTFADALAVLERYGVDAPAARASLERGLRGERPETPKPGDPRLARSETRVIATNQASLEAAAAVLEDAGVHAHLLANGITGEAREVGAVHAAMARQVLEWGQPFGRPCALLSGGETTVTVRGDGRGGRNAEFALATALDLPDGGEVWLLAADTDGIDGSEDNAGVLLSPAARRSMDHPAARRALASNDSYGAFEAVGALLVTGPTRTNVNDLRILLMP